MASKKNKKNKKLINESVPAENNTLHTDTELIAEEELSEDIIAESVEVEREVVEPETEEISAEATEAPAEAEKAVDTLSAPYLVRLVVVLTCICTVIALLLAVVNSVTKDVILANQEKEKQEAILAVFPAGDTVKEYTTADGEVVYIVLKNNEIIGYTVSVSAGGYVGPVDLMIGMTPAGAVDGVKIVSMGETPGVGTKISAESFLSQFKGMDSEVIFGENADAVSGATFSSRAVEEGVNYALSLDVNLTEAAAQLNAVLNTSGGQIDDFRDANEDNGDGEISIGEAVVEGEDKIETEPAETAPAETEPAETEPETTETEPVETEPEPTETEPEVPVAAEPEIPAEPETEAEPVVIPEIPVVSEPEIPAETETEAPVWTAPEVPSWTEPEAPAWTETEAPTETEPEVPAWTEPEIPAETEPEVPAETEPEVPSEPETAVESDVPAEPETSANTETPSEETSETTAEEEPADPSEETEPEIPAETEEETEETEEETEETKKSSNKGGFIFN